MGAFLTTRNLLLRTVQAFVPALARPDDGLARQYLDASEYRLYLRMDPRDRSHCLHVARELLKLQPDADRDLVAAALLHDVGKSLLPFVAWQRVLVHLQNPKGLPARPLQPGLRGARQLKEHHEQLGAELLLAEGVSLAVVSLVRGLGEAASHKHPRLSLLRQADEAT